MPNPPFAGAGNALNLPIDPNTYVSDINDNFTKLQQEVIDLHNRASSITSGISGLFGNGQLELNGDFQITRWLHAKAAIYTIPAFTYRAATANYANLVTGATLGYAGTTYTYHPTVMAGWFIANEMLTQPFGAEDILLDSRSALTVYCCCSHQ